MKRISSAFNILSNPQNCEIVGLGVTISEILSKRLSKLVNAIIEIRSFLDSYYSITHSF